MRVGDRHFRTIWLAEDGETVQIIDQTRLPHAFSVLRLTSVDEAAEAIRAMRVRGAPLIGATAAYGIALAMREEASDDALAKADWQLRATRPTAVNLAWALDAMRDTLAPLPAHERAAAAFARAAAICDSDVALCRAIGDHGIALIRAAWEECGRSRPVNILTHCNAGWLACVDWGTATAPIYLAHDSGIPVHVWVDETRPRNQGAALTVWELLGHGVPHTLIVDNAGGHLMQQGLVDLCIVGTDRTAANGDVANKIGTYLKALAAHDNEVPFYVALPGPSIDWTIADGRHIPIEERSADEITHLSGRTAAGAVETVAIAPRGVKARNFGFDITPSRLVSRLITERGVIEATREALLRAYPERATLRVVQ